MAISGFLLAASGASAPGAMAQQSAEPAKPSAVLPQITVEGTHKKPAPRKAVRPRAPVAAAATAPRPVSPPSTEAVATIDPSRQVQGFVAQSVNTGTKTNTPLREIPQSISVVTREQMNDRGATTLADSIAYSAGVSVNPWGLDTRFDQFILRGFNQNTAGVYRDGLRLPTYSFTGFRIEPYGVDHIDILKGPTAMLYGLNNPGGLVNVVSKTPSDKAFGEVWTSYGSFNSWQTGIDMGGPVDPSGKVSYRITGLVREADNQVDYVENDRVYIAPAVTFHPDSSTTFTLLSLYQRDRTADSYQLLPLQGTLESSPYGHLSRSTFMGEPDWSKFIGEHGSVGYQLEHKVDDAIIFRQSFRYDHATTDYNNVYGAGALLGDPSAILRMAQQTEQTLDLFQTDNQLQYETQIERIGNKLLLGVDASRLVGQSQMGFAGIGNTAAPLSLATLFSSEAYFNPFHPVYGQYYFFDVTSNFLKPISSLPIIQAQTQEQNQLGVYIQDQLKYDRHWLLTLTGREDFVTTEIRNHLLSTSSSSYDEAFSGRAGLGYLFDNGLTPYVSYSTSFFPMASVGFTRDGSALKPETAQQYEAGVKFQPNGLKSYVSGAVFDLTKQNAVEVDPSDPSGLYFTQLGEIEVKGVELEAVADFGNGLKLLAGYSHWDASITEDAYAALVGKRPNGIPADTASGWADYTFQDGMLAGLGGGIGFRYNGDTYGDDANTLKVPSYVLVDAALRYEYDNWKVTAKITNLFDNEYVANCGKTGDFVPGVITNYDYCSYGQARTAMLQVSRKW